VSEREATVFVVDDDLSVRRGLARLLRSAGYRVAAFASAREFLAEAKVDGPSCLVLDIRMPDQSGLDLHEVLIADDQQVPVVFITGHADIPMAARAKKSGAVDFLAKPFDDRTFLGAVQQAIAGSPRNGQNDHPMPKR
jgi:FixJ family two-component response regulator